MFKYELGFKERKLELFSLPCGVVLYGTFLGI